MAMRSLKAIKSHKYGTRHLTAGEEYEAPVRHAFALVASKKARFADKPLPRERPEPIAPTAPVEVAEPAKATAAAELAEPTEPTAPGDLNALRLEATQLGILVDGRWGVARLRYEIRQAKER
jgi:hypothetical protein